MTLTKYVTIAFWYPRTFEQGRKWEDALRFQILDPTGPTKVSYWAWMLPTWYGGKSEKIRLPIKGRQGEPLTEQEYKDRWNRLQKEQDQQRLLEALSRRY